MTKNRTYCIQKGVKYLQNGGKFDSKILHFCTYLNAIAAIRTKTGKIILRLSTAYTGNLALNCCGLDCQRQISAAWPL